MKSRCIFLRNSLPNYFIPMAGKNGTVLDSFIETNMYEKTPAAYLKHCIYVFTAFCSAENNPG